METVTLALNGTSLCDIGLLVFGSSSEPVLAQVLVRNSTARLVSGSQSLVMAYESQMIIFPLFLCLCESSWGAGGGKHMSVGE